jgi:hypothetical protein
VTAEQPSNDARATSKKLAERKGAGFNLA